MSNSEAQQARLRQRFAFFDTNGDGRIDRSDIEAEARRILAAFGESEGSPRGRALVDTYPHLWDYLAEQAGIGSDGSVTLDQFVDINTQHVLAAGPAGIAKVLGPSVHAMLALADTDGDGQVGPQEFKAWLGAVSGGQDIDAETAFQRIDTDGNGQLSVQELVAAVGRYHAGDLDAPLLGI